MSKKYETYKKAVEQLVGSSQDLGLLKAVQDIGVLVDNHKEEEPKPSKIESKMTKVEIMAMRDPVKRRSAIRENMQLFENGGNN
ncbi:hypothetical protein [Niallia circulans]|uniref:Uncharacterized protein n=1 Tax=Niallia circulans TaxID=1397 RepID=A0A941JK20_NIACI|nr:hypothetical protein [Niallia circulans]MCB5238904.1 hypothetical protein [Niallia circulans]